MKAKLIPIGNSRGVRLPKPMIEEAQLEDEVELSVRDRAIVITSTREPRAGWGDAARLLHERGEDALVDAETSTAFDETEWQW
jgi:antitoxin MazE